MWWPVQVTGADSCCGQYRAQEFGVWVTSTGHRSGGGQYRSQEFTAGSGCGQYRPQKSYWPVLVTGAGSWGGCGGQCRPQETGGSVVQSSGVVVDSVGHMSWSGVTRDQELWFVWDT